MGVRPWFPTRQTMECDEAKSVEQCIEIATCDAKDEYEQATGWWHYMDEVFEGVAQVKVLGEVVRFEGFDLEAPQSWRSAPKARTERG